MSITWMTVQNYWRYAQVGWLNFQSGRPTKVSNFSPVTAKISGHTKLRTVRTYTRKQIEKESTELYADNDVNCSSYIYLSMISCCNISFLWNVYCFRKLADLKTKIKSFCLRLTFCVFASLRHWFIFIYLFHRKWKRML